jgi:hypothetical protein
MATRRASLRQTGLEPQPDEYILAGDPEGTTPIRPDSLSDWLAEARGHWNVTFHDHADIRVMPTFRRSPCSLGVSALELSA